MLSMQQIHFFLAYFPVTHWKSVTALNVVDSRPVTKWLFLIFMDILFSTILDISLFLIKTEGRRKRIRKWKLLTIYLFLGQTVHMIWASVGDNTEIYIFYILYLKDFVVDLFCLWSILVFILIIFVCYFVIKPMLALLTLP